MSTDAPLLSPVVEAWPDAKSLVGGRISSADTAGLTAALGTLVLALSS